MDAARQDLPRGRHSSSSSAGWRLDVAALRQRGHAALDGAACESMASRSRPRDPQRSSRRPTSEWSYRTGETPRISSHHTSPLKVFEAMAAEPPPRRERPPEPARCGAARPTAAAFVEPEDRPRRSAGGVLRLLEEPRRAPRPGAAAAARTSRCTPTPGAPAPRRILDLHGPSVPRCIHQPMKVALPHGLPLRPRRGRPLRRPPDRRPSKRLRPGPRGARAARAQAPAHLSRTCPGRWQVDVALPPDYFFYMTPARFLRLAAASPRGTRCRAARKGATLIHAIKDFPTQSRSRSTRRVSPARFPASPPATAPTPSSRSSRRAAPRPGRCRAYRRFAAFISVSRYHA